MQYVLRRDTPDILSGEGVTARHALDAPDILSGEGVTARQAADFQSAPEHFSPPALVLGDQLSCRSAGLVAVARPLSIEICLRLGNGYITKRAREVARAPEPL